MAVIREELILYDRFTKTFTEYIRLGERAAGATQQAAQATRNYQTVLNGLDRRLIAANAQFDAYMQQQNAMLAAGQQNTDEFAQLEGQIEKVGSTIRNLTTQYNAVEKEAAEAARAQEEAARAAAAAQEEAARVAEAAAAAEQHAAEKTARAQERHKRIIDSVSSALKKMVGMDFSKSQAAVSGLDRQFRRFALSLFSVRRILRFMKSSLEHAPQSIQNSWSKASASLARLFGGPVVAALQGLQPHIDRLTAALNSDAGQKLARGLEAIARAGGQAIGFVLDKVSQLVEFMGNNFQTGMTVAAAVAGMFAVKMLFAASATMAAHLPLLLIIGAVTLLIQWLTSLGVTTQQIFGYIGGIIAVVGGFIVNTFIVPIQNAVAAFVNFIGNVFKDPVAAVKVLFYDMALSVIGYIQKIAHGIENLLNKIPGVHVSITSGLDNLYNRLAAARQDVIDASEWKEYVKKWDYVDYTDLFNKGSDFGKNLFNTISDYGGAPYQPVVQDIASDVSAIRKSVDMSQEDLKMLVEQSERRYVNRINLTSQTPVINISGQNTGRTAADRQSLANAIRDILIEQTASGSVISTAVPVVG